MDPYKESFDEYLENKKKLRRQYMDTILPELDKIQEYNSSCKDGRYKNVLIIERVEYGALGTVEHWLSHNNIKSAYYLAETNPYVLRWREGDFFSEFLFASNELDNFDQKDNVLVLANYDMTELKAREHLNKLVSERIAKDTSVEGGERKLNEFWYIIATAYSGGRFGYEPLSEKDIANFDYVIRLESF